MALPCSMTFPMLGPINNILNTECQFPLVVKLNCVILKIFGINKVYFFTLRFIEIDHILDVWKKGNYLLIFYKIFLISLLDTFSVSNFCTDEFLGEH